MVFSVDLLSAYFGARSAQQSLLSGGQQRTGGQTGAEQPRRNPDVLPPWDPRGEIIALDVLRREVMGSGRFFDGRLSDFSRLDVSEDEKQLFAMHQGVRKLQSLVSAASERNVSAADLRMLERRFNQGLEQLDGFFKDLSLEGVTVLKGEELTKAESDLRISRGESRYTGGVVHKGARADEVAAFQDGGVFTLTVRKNGADTNINIDLADMGATPRTMDNVAAHINEQLESFEMLSRFEAVRIGPVDSNGIVQGDSYGFRINGILTERVSFSAPQGDPAIFLAGVSGEGDSIAGQLTKITNLDSGGQTVFAKRIEADFVVTETTLEDGETRTSQEANPFEALAMARSADGGLFVVGHASNAVNGQAIRGEKDLVLIRYDSTGKEVFTRTLGAAGEASGASVAVDAQGNVVVAGSVTGELGGTLDFGGADSLVSKFTADGVEVFTRRFGAQGDDRVNSVSIGADGTIFLGGEARASFGGMQNQGGLDGFVRAISADGDTLFTRSIEAGAGNERVRATAIAADGGLITASEVDGRAVLTRFAAGDDGTGAPLWTLDLGHLDGGRIGAIGVDDDGAIFLTGAAGANFAPSDPLQANQGGRDAVLIKIADGAEPAVEFTTFLGTAEDNAASALTLADGKVYIAGRTSGALPGSEQAGERNSFAAGFDAATGALEFTQQVSGRAGVSSANAIVVDPKGDSFVDRLGMPSGNVIFSDTRLITARSSVRAGDHFFVTVDGGRQRRIEIAENETMRSLTFKLNSALLFKGTADVRRTQDGEMLRITPKEGVNIEFTRGSGGRDALSGLGLPEGTVTGKASLLNRNRDSDSTSDAPRVFALGIPSGLSISTRDRALAAGEIFAQAQDKIQRAWRELTADPALKDLFNGPQAGRRGGTVPAHLTGQLANYQAGLDRLMSGDSATLGFF